RPALSAHACSAALTVPSVPTKTVEWAAFWTLAAALLLLLRLHLFVALLAGLSAFALHRALPRLLGRALKPVCSRHLATAATLRAMAYALAGLVIGMLASISGPNHAVGPSTFMQAWRARLAQLEQAFIDVVAAQLRIALINTALTAAYLVLLVPLLGWRVPLT